MGILEYLGEFTFSKREHPVLLQQSSTIHSTKWLCYIFGHHSKTDTHTVYTVTWLKTELEEIRIRLEDYN